MSWLSDPNISVKTAFLSWKKSRTWSGRELQAGLSTSGSGPGELCKASCQVLSIWSGGTPLFRSAHLHAILPPLVLELSSQLGLPPVVYAFSSSFLSMHLHLVQITAPGWPCERREQQWSKQQKKFSKCCWEIMSCFSFLCMFSCFFHFMANWAKAKLPIHHCLTTSLFLMMTVYSKNSSLKCEKLVIRTSMQFQKQSYSNSQQLNVWPLDLTLIAKWVNSFQSMNDCIENLKNWHCMKKHCLAARDSSYQPEMSSAQASAFKLTATSWSLLIYHSSVPLHCLFHDERNLEVHPGGAHFFKWTGETHMFYLETTARGRLCIFSVSVMTRKPLKCPHFRRKSNHID